MMSRMHARKKGKSGSTHPKSKAKPAWVPYSKEEIKDLITKLFKEGNSISEIGTILRDQYGVPSVKATAGKTVSQILSAEKMLPKWPEDFMNLLKKAVKLMKHMEKNKSDKHNKRILQLTEAKIRRLTRYYKKTGVISSTWHYKPEEAALLIKE